MTRRCPWKKPRPAGTPLPPPQEETTTTPRPRPSSFVRGEHAFHIVGYSARKVLARDAHPSILSGAFHVGGHTWALDCGFDDDGHLASVSLQLLTAYITDDVVVKASLVIEDPLCQCPAAEWLSEDAYTFPVRSGRSWTLPLPDAFHGGQEARFVQDDRLTIVCTLDVLEEDDASTMDEDFHKLLLVLLGEKSESDSERKRHPSCMLPDVTFLVEQTEIEAHRLVLAMRSPVFAAELLGDMRESTTSRLRVDDMSASTFRAMIRFIYTDKLPIKARKKDSITTALRACKEKCEARRRVAMACELLVAADRYDLEKLRLMCEEMLYESMDAASVMPTLLVADGRYNCRKLEASCIEYLASNAEVYATVKETEEYKELEKHCCSFIAQVMDKVATYNKDSSFRTNNSSPKCPKMTTTISTYNTSEVIRGTHMWRIPSFSSVRESHGVGQELQSSTFRIGGYEWDLSIYPSGRPETLKENTKKDKHIPVHATMLTDPGTAGVRASVSFRIDDPSGESPPTTSWLQSIFTWESSWGFQNFTTVKDVKSRYLAHDGSLTIRCDIVITNKASIGAGRVGDTTTLAMSPNITWHLQQLLVSEKGSDVMFLVEEREIHAHRLVIATRSPVLYEVVVSNEDDRVVIVDVMKYAVFKAMLHFIYTDDFPPIEDLVPADRVSGDDVMIAGEILAAACRFRLDKLKAKCENFLGGSTTRKNVSRVLKLARRHHCSKLEDHCIEFDLTD